MKGKAVAVFLFMLCLDHTASQSPASVGGSVSVLTSTVATCGVGSNVCPSDQTVEVSELPVTLDASTTVASQETTVSSTVSQAGDSSATPQATLAAENVTKPALMTSTKQKSPSTTPLPPIKSAAIPQIPEDQLSGYAPNGICACDLTAYSCDINCCCDQECSKSQRKSFSWCKVEGYPPYDNRYCYAAKLIFLNNSELVLQQTENGAFCIVRSNLAGSALYPSHTIFTTREEFVKHWERTHSPVWPGSFLQQEPSIDKPKVYTAGSPVWTLRDNHIQTLELPSSGLTPACSMKETVKYLLPWSSKCMQQAPDSQFSCERVSSYFHHKLQNIVRSPILVNQSELLEAKIVELCPADVCIPVRYFVCSGSSLEENHANNCKNISSKKMFFGLKSGVCYGVVRKLKLFFQHNGTEGINNAEAYMWLSNMSLAEFKATTPLHQSFSVDFRWAAPNKTAEVFTKNTTHTANSSSGEDHKPFFRSGNQGYVVGKPVIAGFRVKQTLAANVSKDSGGVANKADIITLSHDPNLWLTLPGLNSNGMCDLTTTQRHVVAFGEDLHMSCGIALTPRNISSKFSCNTLRSKMLQLLLGDITNSLIHNSLQPDWGRVIAAFGSANVAMSEDWVPLLVENQPPFTLLAQASVSIDSNVPEDNLEMSSDLPVQTCENVPFGVQIQIMHGRVGTASNPQSKIFGAGLRFAPLQDVGWACNSAPCVQKSKVLHYRVVSTVKFVDITSPAVTRFAEPPAIHIRLPPDFFYPFMTAEGSSSSSLHRTNLTLFVFIFLCLLYFV